MLWFDEDDVARLAGPGYRELAYPYLYRADPVLSRGELVADIVGTDERVRLAKADGGMDHSCTCPAGLAGVFCAHCTATALSALSQFGPPDVLSLRHRIRDLGRFGRIASTNLTRWSELLDALLADLEVSSQEGYAVLIRPCYQDLLRVLVRQQVYVDSEEVEESVLRSRERVIAGFADTCRSEPARGDELAEWVIDLQTRTDSLFALELADVVDILGEDGLVSYRHLVNEARRRVTDDDDDHSQTICYLHDELYPEVHEDPSHRARAMAGRGDHQEHARRRWDLFTRHPDERRYRELLAASAPLGAQTYATGRVLAHLRELAAEPGPRACTPLVDHLVAGGDVAGAWAAAHEFGLDSADLLALARRRAATHPAEAIPIILDAAVQTVDHRSGQLSFARAAGLLAEAALLHDRAGLDFEPVRGRFTAAYAHHPLLLALIDDCISSKATPQD
ncbi:hypothetical protein [Actinokineospora diospyrosa]|uniref:SWIM-type domain-containing protein n=1 Tax=Actinokineospora diospyrosa TaxID=103728 RepID=A0ABT1IJ28_9PSEU|nr:hypothetical protein [Actinokineospora diospyrosa]MCP2272651.1 hypothetical protein [Actinokineospora diospyrosa]